MPPPPPHPSPPPEPNASYIASDLCSATRVLPCRPPSAGWLGAGGNAERERVERVRRVSPGARVCPFQRALLGTSCAHSFCATYHTSPHSTGIRHSLEHQTHARTRTYTHTLRRSLCLRLPLSVRLSFFLSPYTLVVEECREHGTHYSNSVVTHYRCPTLT